MTDLKERIQQLAKENLNQTIANRRHIHANPELSFKEFKTQQFIKDQLAQYGIAKVEEIANTGLVGLIEGKNPAKKVVALRADIDALPIVEKNEVEYKSSNEGVMHACGHDAHTASLLGAANILNELKDRFEGTVKLIFQPGEEKAPGGASIMIKEGVLDNPAPNAVLGQHVMPYIPAGKVGFKEGIYMASADEIYVTVKGKGGHGAMPDFCIDPVLISAHIITSLQQIVSRNANPKMPSVLTFGKVIANGATNVIPSEVKIEGTFRTLDEKWRFDAHKKMVKMAEGIAEAMGGSCEFNIAIGYPVLVNNPELTRKTRSYAVDYLGSENVIDLDIWMAAEDFAFYSQATEASFYRLGTRNEAKGFTSGVHTPTFNIDESALEIGAGLIAYMTIRELSA